jgi:hypothetical protein
LRRRRQRRCAALGCHAIAARRRCSHFLAEDDIASLKNFSFVLSFIGPKMLRHLKVFSALLLSITPKSLEELGFYDCSTSASSSSKADAVFLPKKILSGCSI